MWQMTEHFDERFRRVGGGLLQHDGGIRGALLQLREGLFDCAQHLDLGLGGRQRLSHASTQCHIALDDQAVQPRQCCGQRCLGFAGGLQRQGDPEAGALAETALHGDLAAHGFDETLADGQAQAGAAELPGGGRFGLCKRCEQPGQGLLRDTDAVVGHGEADPAWLSRGRLDLQAHPAGRTTRATAELDGIAEQVVEDLSQSGRVGPDVARQLGIDKQIERDLFLVGEAAQGIAYAFRERR